MKIAHQPGSEPLTIPEQIPNPAVRPAPPTRPEREPDRKEPVKVPEKEPANRIVVEARNEAASSAPHQGMLVACCFESFDQLGWKVFGPALPQMALTTVVTSNWRVRS